MKFTLPTLPYALDALAPYMSQKTLEYHYGKHHQAYVNNINKLVVGSEFEQCDTLEEIILRADGAIYNNAAQAWNHQFFFEQFSPKPNPLAPGALQDGIVRDFGSFDKFVELFSAAAASFFGSGWVWLVRDSSGTLSITSTSNAHNPMTAEGVRPLLTIDVWEHAYYLDYQNVRADYIKNFWQIVDWQVIDSRF